MYQLAQITKQLRQAGNFNVPTFANKLLQQYYMKKFYFALAFIISSNFINSQDLQLIDIDSKTIGQELVMKRTATSDGTAIVEANPTDPTRKAIHVTSRRTGTLLRINLTFPTARTLVEYDSITFRIYRNSNDADLRKLQIYFDYVKYYEDSNLVNQGIVNAWTLKTYPINWKSNMTVAIDFGISSEQADYYIDNIELKERKIPVVEAEKSLRKYAAMQNKYIGTCVGNNSNFYSLYYNSPTHIFYKTVNDNFNCVVAENEFKPYAIHSSRYAYNYTNVDKLIAFTDRNNVRLRGHTLIWHSQLPSWMGAGSTGLTNTNNYTRDTLLKIMKEHIINIVSHCRGKVKEWDVVNEPFEGSGALRKSIWQQVIGDDFIDSAFVYAHQADPEAILYLNEYGVEEMGGSKSEAMFNLISKMKNKGIPIHGAGLQCHFSVSGFNPAKVEQNIKRYAPLGLNCIITELDLSLPIAAFGIAENYKQQAINYATLTDIWLRNDNSPTFVMWGFTDLYSWIPSNSGNTRGEALIFDTKYQPKPAYNAILNTIAYKTLKTDVDNITFEKDAFKTIQTSDYIQIVSDETIKRITLFNIAGQCVKTTTNSNEMKISDCKSGIYIIQIETGTSLRSKKMILKK